MKEKQKNLFSYNQQLMYAFDFTSDDLAANRRGYITLHQLANFRKRKEFRLQVTGLITLLLLILFISSIVSILIQGIESSKGMSSMSVLLFIFFIIFSLNTFYYWRKLQQVSESTELGKIQGIAIVVSGGRDSSPLLRVNHLHFNLNDKKVHAIRSGREVIVYFIPSFFEIIALEETKMAEETEQGAIVAEKPISYTSTSYYLKHKKTKNKQ